MVFFPQIILSRTPGTTNTVLTETSHTEPASRQPKGGTHQQNAAAFQTEGYAEVVGWCSCNTSKHRRVNRAAGGVQGKGWWNYQHHCNGATKLRTTQNRMLRWQCQNIPCNGFVTPFVIRQLSGAVSLENPAQTWKMGWLKALRKDLRVSIKLLASLLILNCSGKICNNKTRAQWPERDSIE